MSPFGSLTAIWRAEVSVPEDVFRAFGHTKEYEEFSLSASKDMPASGSDRYSDVIEWAEGPSQWKAEEFINRWHNRILQWQEQLRRNGA